MRYQQYRFKKLDISKVHGGSAVHGSAKVARPLCTKRPIHLVMKSSLATGALKMNKLENQILLRGILAKQSKAFGVEILDLAINDNHFHAIVRATNRGGFKGFLRAIAGWIARKFMGAEKGRPKKRKFWDGKPFTRVVEWGRDFMNLKNYLVKNKFEAMGFATVDARVMAKRYRDTA